MHHALHVLDTPVDKHAIEDDNQLEPLVSMKWNTTQLKDDTYIRYTSFNIWSRDPPSMHSRHLLIAHFHVVCFSAVPNV